MPAGLAWSTSYVLAGYLAGSSLDEISALISQATLGIAALLVTTGAAAILLRRRARRPPFRRDGLLAPIESTARSPRVPIR